MNLLILLGKFSAGGTERSVSYLTQYLPSEIKPTIVVTETRADYPYRGTLRLVALPPFTKRRQYHIHVVRFLKWVWDVRRAVRETGPDVTLAFTPGWGLLGALCAPNLVFYFQTTASTAFGTKGYQKLRIRFICRRARVVLCISEGVKKDLEEHFGVRGAEVVPVPADIGLIARMKDLPPTDPTFLRWRTEGKRICITAGRASPAKGHEHLVRAFAGASVHEPARLVIMGDGVATHADLRRLIRELGIADRVLLLGFEQNPFAYLSRADVFVLSSVREGFPLVCGEAMACGLPVLSVDCPSGPREILAPDTPVDQVASRIEYARYGVLTPPFDGPALSAAQPLTRAESFLAGAMTEMLGDAHMRERYAAASRERAHAFSMDTFAIRMGCVLERAAAFSHP